MDRLESLLLQHERGKIAPVEWLDALVFREIERIHQTELSSSNSAQRTHPDGNQPQTMCLYIELPTFDVPVVHGEPEITAASDPFLLRPAEPTLSFVNDPEMYRENPTELMHRRLARSHRGAPLDRELKPNARIRDELNNIIKYPPTRSLDTHEKDLVWTFRFYLSRNKQALTKFLKSVSWTDAQEVRQAIELMDQWSLIDVSDALELLGHDFSHPKVRGYAVNRLKAAANDDDLLLYLLQLVQALRFDVASEIDSGLADFLIERSVSSPILANYLHWYLRVECEAKGKIGHMYSRISSRFLDALHLRRQGELIQYLSRISKELRSSRELRTRKIERLRQIIASPQSGLSSFPPLTFPLDPSIRITGIVADNSSIFKSSMMPLFLTFKTSSDGDGSGQPMFKTGDDLRQDQLVIQLITLMDKLLRNENLDLRLMPYKALATGHDSGFIQLIDAEALASILTDHAGSLLSYLRLHRPDPSPSGILGVDPTVMDTYIRSCAGYCVITYLLGVGDRHLDNLMLTKDGNLFHIDFGFILGRDPKPFPPPMKLCKEMIEAMGGEQSPLFQQQFRSYCYTAFGILRRSANLILNLLSLMVDAGIPDIAVEPDRAVLKVQEKFRLDLTEEEAVELFDTLITDSANALFPQIVERLHAWAQYWRA
ncbi:phosphatidylinositol 3-kinase [Ramicandelaber brevisporus]|nr:phosphatidylinositol 3-kinase [Ramicandelaber brevisporus]